MVLTMEPPKSKHRLDTFDLAFLYQFQTDMRPILLKECWKEVEDWEIEWVEMRAKLLQQPQIDPETTKSTEQEITAVSTEIQAKIEEYQEIKHKTANQQFSKDELEEDPEIVVKAKFQMIHIHKNLSSKLHVEGVEGEPTTLQNATKFTDQDPNPNIADQPLIPHLNSTQIRSQFQSIKEITYQMQDEENEVEMDELASSDGDATDGFKDRRTGEGSELVNMVVAQRPQPEPPNLNSHLVAKVKHWTSTLELENRARRRHHHPTAAAVSRENERHTLLGYGDCAEINEIAKGKGDTTLNEGGGWSQSGSKDDNDSDEDPSLILTVTPTVTSITRISILATQGANASHHCRVRPFLGRPRKLLAAVLPWNRYSLGDESDGNKVPCSEFVSAKSSSGQI